jgi:hypothetical protein
MVDKKQWEDFQDSGLLWWINRILHTFGWAIVLVQEADGSISSAYPARVSYRGFSEADDEAGYARVARHMNEIANDTK